MERLELKKQLGSVGPVLVADDLAWLSLNLHDKTVHFCCDTFHFSNLPTLIKALTCIKLVGNLDDMIPKLAYRPWTAKDCPLRLGDTIIGKYDGTSHRVSELSAKSDGTIVVRYEMCQPVHGYTGYFSCATGDGLFESYKWNGAPCGAEVK